jgi:hypothetical protein
MDVEGTGYGTIPARAWMVKGSWLKRQNISLEEQWD